MGSVATLEFKCRWSTVAPLRALHEHSDRRPNALIDEDHESFFLFAKKYCDAAAGRRHRTDLHFDNGLAHVASLGTYVPSRYRIALGTGGPTIKRAVSESWVSVLCNALFSTALPGHEGRRTALFRRFIKNQKPSRFVPLCISKIRPARVSADRSGMRVRPAFHF